MKIQLLVIHERESYPGEYAPNVLACWDEYLEESNPAGREIHFAEELAKENPAAHAVVTIEVPVSALMEALYPAEKTVKATVMKETK